MTLVIRRYAARAVAEWLGANYGTFEVGKPHIVALLDPPH